MQSTKILFGVALIVALACAQEFVNTPTYCQSITCEEPRGCKGEVLADGGLWGCCPACARVEGETCGTPRGYRGFSVGECATGLQCILGDGLYGSCQSKKT